MKFSGGEIRFAQVLHEPDASAIARVFGIPGKLGQSNGVVLCAVTQGTVNYVGLARCSRQDAFDPLRGRKLALTSALRMCSKEERRAIWQEVLPKLGVKA